MAQIRTAAYCRVSTMMEDQEGSYENQVAYYNSYITGNPNLAMAGIYGDHGISGRNASRRPGFQKLIADCEAGKIDLVLCKSISRFARNLQDCIGTLRHLRDLKVRVVFEKEAIDTLDPKMEFVINCLAAIAEEESISIGRNLKWANTKRNSAGTPSRVCAYGYKKDQDGNWIVDVGAARRVVCAFSMANQGHLFYEIRDELNRMENEEKTGEQWSQTRMTLLFKNEAYCGDILTNKTYSPGGKTRIWNKGQREQFYIEEHHEPLVPHNVFDRVGELVKRKLLWKNRKLLEEEVSFLQSPLPYQSMYWR